MGFYKPCHTFITLILFVLPFKAFFGQVPKAPLNSFTENTLERWEIKMGKHYPTLGTHLKPFARAPLSDKKAFRDTFLTYLNANTSNISAVDRYELRQLAGLNPLYWDSVGNRAGLRKPSQGLFNTFYQRKQILFDYRNKDLAGNGLSLYINPVLKFSGGKALEDDELLFQNTRGISIRGGVDETIGFQFRLTENQVRYPSYVDAYVDSHQVVPGFGFWKDFNEKGYDFLNATGSIDFELSEHIHLEFGHGDHFIGQGYRSLLLSDFGPNYLFLRLQTQVGILDYQNIFTEFVGQDLQQEPYNKKYGAFHHLSLDVLPNLQLGLFEGVIFHDSRNNGRGFELNYLNPVILYRSVDHSMGSPDNILIGLDADYLPFEGVQVYGQFIVDEFKIDEFRSGEGWWGNKYGWQLGAKYLDAFGVGNLDLQLEYNGARPYLYSQRESGLNYLHYNQPLAHPLGANFQEGIAEIRYQPFKRWYGKLRGGWAKYGADTGNANWGGNVRISYNKREQDYGNRISQGVETILQWGQVTIGYEPWPNLFLEVEGRFRQNESELDKLDRRNLYLGGALRYHFAKKHKFF